MSSRLLLAFCLALLVGAIMLFASIEARADTVHFYKDASGTYCFTDDVNRVPEAYTATAMDTDGGIKNYDQYTHKENSRSGD
jgi:hypothetical protein